MVHGPVTVTILAGLAERYFGRRRVFSSFRATAPTFARVPVVLLVGAADDAEGLTLRALRADRVDAVTAQADRPVP